MTTSTSTLGLPLDAVTFTRHFLAQAIAKGFTAEQIVSAVTDPYKVTDVTAHEGQSRYCGAGIAVVIDDHTGHAITAYADGIVTPLREDQRHDAAALNSRRLAGVA